MEKVYDSKSVEQKWRKYWIENKTFSAVCDKNKKPFTIVIPPPNVTGSLHMGHALNNTLQDIIIRFKKLSGFNTLWVPGTDHGGIATQNVVEKLLKKEGKTKYDLGREKFLETMWKWRNDTGDTILQQLKQLGCGLDWDRTAFTMDESRSKSVKRAFIDLFNKGLIYRGKRLVNWCPRCATALSDIEVEYADEKSNLWHIKYPFRDSEGYVIVATTRPETMLGDTAVAVSPDDERYANVVGQTIKLPIVNREIKIVSDYIVEKSFGTGAVKVTPAHDATDNEISKRNNLEIIEIIDADGKMINVPEKYKGLSVKDARQAVVKDLEEGGFLVKIEDYSHSVGRCYRCSTTIEPLMSEQWFLNVGDMSKKAVSAANEEKTKFYPSSWKKPYVLWLENLRDWCISRQIWWGHRIPVYYCVDQKGNKNTNCKPIAAAETPKECPNCKGIKFVQDEDVLDTWFSSALWPISVFNWGENPDNEDLKYFYPTSVLATGHEILYLWVARMVQFGLEFMKEVPYSHVFIHGIVRDKQGKKMSKSLGNVIDPLTIMEQYGTDALRFALAQAAAPGRDMQISDESFLAARNFANKIWNASRFIIMNLEGIDKLDETVKPSELADEWILAEFENARKKISAAYESYDMDCAARELYDFFWTKYCDWYIELSKIRMMSEDIAVKKQVLSILIKILKSALQLMSPVMPFITSEIWEILNKKDSAVIAETTLQDAFEIPNKESVVEKMSLIQDVITKIRTLRSEMNISPAVQVEAIFNISDSSKENILKDNESYVKQLAKISAVKIGKNLKRPNNSALAVAGGFEIFLPLEGLIDIEKEKARLAKEILAARQEIDRTNAKLSNENFIKRAPAAEVEKINIRLNEAKLKIEKIEESLKFLG
ncbi:valine--tRNA ligase [Endomicrobium proavitum]|uniref:Valine--tRNA ligase n=1 Tax=Endomicrobium proavitum TaxID=1408281 RepID=A0A0G3WI17_9BACT|nr:valine--tRNA ligase [Endomicrobium proavitum]AKL97525.1 Valine--tRNA ligase [Endomicrobium proavitum]